jgi:hypothetical protein
MRTGRLRAALVPLVAVASAMAQQAEPPTVVIGSQRAPAQQEEPPAVVIGSTQAPAQQAEPPSVVVGFQQGPAQRPAETGDRVTITAMVPIPNVGKGAPYRATEDLSRMKGEGTGQRTESIREIQQFRQCRQQQSDFAARRLAYVLPSMEGLLEREVDASFRFATLAGKAEEATRAAEDVRRLAADGQADMKAVEAAELKRQDSVNELEDARIKFREAGAAIADFQELERSGKPASVNGQFIDDDDAIAWGDIDLRASLRRKAGWWDGIPAPDIPKDLAIADIEAHQLNDTKGAFVQVTGEIRNSGAKAANVPDLIVSVIDKRGWVIEAMPLSAPSSVKVPAGGKRPFAYEMRPVPAASSKITVSFGSKVAPPPRLPVRPPDC